MSNKPAFFVVVAVFYCLTLPPTVDVSLSTAVTFGIQTRQQPAVDVHNRLLHNDDSNCRSNDTSLCSGGGGGGGGDEKLLAIVAEERLLSCRHHNFSCGGVDISSSNNNNNDTVEKIADRVTSFFLSGVALAMGHRHPVILRPTLKISTWLVHSFSPKLDEEIRTNVFMPDKENGLPEMHLLSPGLLRLPSKKYLVVLRIWFNQESKVSKPIENSYPENFIYQQVLSADFSREEVPGSLVPIPSPSQFVSGAGPSDPRVFTVGSSIFVNFYMLRDSATVKGRMFLWDATRRRLFQPVIQNFEHAMIESNWSPFDFGGKLYYVYMHNPLRILKCEFVGATLPCEFVFDQSRAITTMNKDDNAPNVSQLEEEGGLILRGGTPLIHYHTLTAIRQTNSVPVVEDQHYYLTAIHSVVHSDDGRKRYNAHLVLLRAISDAQRNLSSMCTVFISRSLNVSSQVFESTRVVLADQISDPFIFPVGLVLLDDDSEAKSASSSSTFSNSDCLLLSYHASDDRSFISRYCGLRALLAPILSPRTACLSEMLTPPELDNYVTRHLV